MNQIKPVADNLNINYILIIDLIVRMMIKTQNKLKNT